MGFNFFLRHCVSQHWATTLRMMHVHRNALGKLSTVNMQIANIYCSRLVIISVEYNYEIFIECLF